jgi:hypothetical protein
MGVGGQLHAPAALPPGKRPGTHCIGVEQHILVRANDLTSEFRWSVMFCTLVLFALRKVLKQTTLY